MFNRKYIDSIRVHFPAFAMLVYVHSVKNLSLKNLFGHGPFAHIYIYKRFLSSGSVFS